jgi:hypothetical protein
LEPQLLASLLTAAEVWKVKGRFIHWAHLVRLTTMALSAEDLLSPTYLHFNAAQLEQRLEPGLLLSQLMNTLLEMGESSHLFQMVPPASSPPLFHLGILFFIFFLLMNK